MTENNEAQNFENQFFAQNEQHSESQHVGQNEDEFVPKNSTLMRQFSTTFQGFKIRIEDLITYVPETKEHKGKAILKGISTEIPKGTMTAIVGPSGSGKTTFMNYLSGRQEKSQMFRNYAHYFINDTEIETINDFKNIVGYVQQDDLMDELMTPRQLFEFYYNLRWNVGDTYEKRNRECKIRVDEMIELLGLVNCADTIVGNSQQRGLSGGERKRVNIGIELICQPNLLFLDEPTTGLDSTNALKVMQVVQNLLQRGITIISTIHSPSAKILKLFDKILILVDGQLIYDDSPKNISKRLDEIQMHPENPKQPPLEYFMKIIDKDDLRVTLMDEIGEENLNTKEKMDEFEKDVTQKYNDRIYSMFKVEEVYLQKRYQEKWKEQFSVRGNQLMKLKELALQKNLQRTRLYQFYKLFGKNFYLMITDFHQLAVRIMSTVILTIILILIYLDIGDIEDNPYTAWQNRSGFIFMAYAFACFSNLNVAASYLIPIKQIFLKDKDSRIYSPTMFYIACLFFIYPFFILILIIQQTAYYYIVGLNQDDFVYFIWYQAFMLVGGFVYGTFAGMLGGVLVDDKKDLGSVLPLFMLPAFLLAGYFQSVKKMTWPLKVLSYISIMRWSFQGLMLNEFRNRQEYIDACTLTGGQQSQCDPMSFFDFYENKIWVNFLATIGVNCLFLFVSYGVFMRKYREKDAIMEYDPKMIEEYAKINKNPLKQKVKEQLI